MDREESVTTPPEQPPPDGRDKRENLERYGRYRVPRRSEPLRPDLQLYEVRQGLKPGSRYVRITPSAQQTLRKMAPAHLQATDVLLRPRTVSGQIWTGLKSVLVGSPLASSQAINERLDKVRALAVFSADAISSTAYATEEILLVLVLAGTGALSASLPIAAVIGAAHRGRLLLPADGAGLPERRRFLHRGAGEPGDLPRPDGGGGPDDRLRADGRREHVGRGRRSHLGGAGPLQRAPGAGPDRRLDHRHREPAGHP